MDTSNLQLATGRQTTKNWDNNPLVWFAEHHHDYLPEKDMHFNKTANIRSRSDVAYNKDIYANNTKQLWWMPPSAKLFLKDWIIVISGSFPTGQFYTTVNGFSEQLYYLQVWSIICAYYQL